MSIEEKLAEHAAQHNRQIDSTVAWFEKRLNPIVNRAQSTVLSKLRAELEFDDAGRLARTPRNTRALLELDLLFKRQMNRAGYGDLVKGLSEAFGRQIPTFEEALEILGLPKPRWTEADKGWFAEQIGVTEQGLETVVVQAAQTAKRRALLSMAGLRGDQLVDLLATSLSTTTAKATEIADTGITVFYRTVAERGYEKIDPEKKQKYKAFGPNDKLNRPFCKRIMASTRSYTRAEIDAMENGQTPNAFVTFGGYRCRHQWALDIGESSADKKGGDRRTAAEVRNNLAATNQSFEARLEALRKDAAAAAPDSADALDARRKLAALNATRLEKLREVLHAPAPGAVNVQVRGAAPKNVFKAAAEAGRFLSNLLGQDANALMDVRYRPRIRARYIPSLKRIEVAGDDGPDIHIHEAGHWLEDHYPALLARSIAFLERRTTLPNGTRESLEPLWRGSKERVRKDRFFHAYVGKDYTSPAGAVRATEILSMGLQYLYRDPAELATMDPDFFDFLWESIRSIS